MSLLAILSLLFSMSVQADCFIGEGTTKVILPESKAVSLFDEGKSLSQFKVQDQDGLGTCYANTTSAQLAAVLDGHPEISYLHAGIVHGASTEAWARGESQYVSQAGTSMTNTGNVCETVEGLKKAGGACPKQYSLLEKKEGVDREMQKTLLLGLGKYFDRLNAIKTDPKQLAKLDSDLSLSLEIIELETNKLRQSCLERKQQTYPSKAALKYLLMPAVQEAIEDKTLCGQNRLKKLKSFMTSYSRINQDEMLIDPTPELQTHLEQFLEADSDLKESLAAYFNSENNLVSESLIKGFLPKLENFLKLEVGVEDDSSCPSSIIVNSLLHSVPRDSAKTFLRRMRSDKRAQCKDEFLNDDTLKMITSAGDQHTCLDPTNLQEILNLVAPLVNVGAILGKNLVLELSNLDSGHAEQLTNSLMPECMDPTKLIKLEKVNCESFHMCDQGTGKKPYSRYSGPAGYGKCHSLESAKELTRSKVVSEINHGGALGLNACVPYFYDAKAPATGFCRKQPPAGQVYPYHIMTVSGYRCIEGKMEYEILNSWGKKCPVENKNENFECSTSANGEASGRFWIKEDVMVDSTQSLTSLKVLP